MRTTPAILALIALTGLPWAFGCSGMRVGTTSGAAAGPRGGGARYSLVEIDYFLEVALEVEYADGPQRRVIRRWSTDRLPAVRLSIEGPATRHDRAAVRRIVDEINAIVGMPLVAIDPERPNAVVRFVPRHSMRDYTALVPRRGARGFVAAELAADYTIVGGQVLIATDLPWWRRGPIIREEVTQLLGLFNDPDWYPESIFHDGNFDDRYAPIDRAVIAMLYHPEMTAGLDERRSRAILGTAAR